MKIEITDEQKDDIVRKTLKNDLESFKNSLEKMKTTKEREGYISYNYKKDKKEIEQMIKSLEKVIEYYKVF